MNGREALRECLRRCTPSCAQEEADLALLLSALDSSEPVFERSCLGRHFTASAWVVNPARTQVLMAYHNIYRSWAWLGGHADGETDLSAVALREVREESGIEAVRLLSPEPASVEILAVSGHEKHGSYVPSHLHLNVTWFIEADDSAAPVCKPDENSAVGWLTPGEAVRLSEEPWFRERIYPKLNARARALGFLCGEGGNG